MNQDQAQRLTTKLKARRKEKRRKFRKETGMTPEEYLTLERERQLRVVRLQARLNSIGNGVNYIGSLRNSAEQSKHAT